MTIIQCKYALAVEKYKSFSKAAEKLFISQPALSLQIKALEQELQYVLFIRAPQGVTLTPEGRRFCREAADVMDAWEKFQRNVTRPDETRRRQLRIGVGPRALTTGIFHMVCAFFNAHPAVEVTFITTDLDYNALEALSQKSMDFAVDRLPPSPIRQTMNLSDYMVVELLRERQCVLMSHDDPQSDLPFVRFRELQGRAIISGPTGSTDNKAMDAVCRKHNVVTTSVYRADNLDVMMDLIRNGQGITIASESFADYYQVSAVPILPEKYISLNLMCLKTTAADPDFTALRDYLIACLRTDSRAATGNSLL